MVPDAPLTYAVSSAWGVLDPSVGVALLLTTTVPFILFSRPMGQYHFQQACASNAKN